MLCNNVFAINKIDAKKNAEKILENLFVTTGNYIQGTAPTIIIVEGKKGGAAYSPSYHSIKLDMAVIEMCQTFGSKSDDALAFILAHELAHSYQKELKSTNFWEYYLHKNCTKNEERAADIFGIFNAYLAGYKTVEIVPEVISAIYKIYELNDKISGYPAKQERMDLALKVQTKVQELIKIYEVANYLTAIGKYDLAAASYGHILQFYQGREIYNNLGINYALQAMNFMKQDLDLYLYPFEMDWLTRMKKPKSSRGPEDLTPEQQVYRSHLLTLAIDAFREVNRMDGKYLAATINNLCATTLLGDYNSVVTQYDILESNGLFAKHPKQKEKLKLIAAIAKAHIPSQQNTAISIWADLKNSPNAETEYQANYNTMVLEEEECNIPDDHSCREPFSSEVRIDEVLLHRAVHYDKNRSINLDSTFQFELVIEEKNSSLVYRYFINSKPDCSLQQIFETKPYSLSGKILKEGLKFDMLTSNVGYLLTCKEKKSVFIISSDNRTKEWAKYYLY